MKFVSIFLIFILSISYSMAVKHLKKTEAETCDQICQKQGGQVYQKSNGSYDCCTKGATIIKNWNLVCKTPFPVTSKSCWWKNE